MGHFSPTELKSDVQWSNRNKPQWERGVGVGAGTLARARARQGRLGSEGRPACLLPAEYSTE